MAMAHKRGGLLAEDKEKLRKNRKNILDNLYTESIMDYFVEKGVLSIPQVVSEIDSDSLTPRDKTRKLLDLLEFAGPGAFGIFMSILEAHDYKEMAIKIKQTPVNMKIKTHDTDLDEESIEGTVPDGIDKHTSHSWERHIPDNIRDQHISFIEHWRRQDKNFIVTRAAERVMEIQKSSNHVIITGSSGSGKSSIAHHLALELQDKEGYDIIPFLTDGPGDVTKYINMNKKQVFVIDDICGTATICTQYFEQWLTFKDNFEQITKHRDTNKHIIGRRTDVGELQKLSSTCNSVKLLITCRLNIYRDPKFQRLKFLIKPVCNITSSDTRLNESERKLMLRKYLSSDTTYSIIDTLSRESMYDFFPLLCKLSAGKNEENIQKLFASPIDTIEGELKVLRDGDEQKVQYLCIALCVLFDNEFNEQVFKVIPTETYHALCSICQQFEINIELQNKRNLLKTAFDIIHGSFVTKTGNKYSLIHDKVYEIAATHFGTELFDCFIKFSSSTFICNRYILRINVVPETTARHLIVIEKVQEDQYFNRLIDDLINGQPHTILNNHQLRDESFRNLLIGNCKNRWQEVKKAIKDIANKAEKFKVKDEGIGRVDNYEKSISNARAVLAKSKVPLIIAALEGHPDIVNTILEAECDVNQIDGNSRTALFVASLFGHLSVVKLLIVKGADVNVKCEMNDLSPLHVACENGYFRIAQQLLENGADISYIDKDGCSSLHYACTGGNTEIIQMLLNHNANMSLCTHTGDSPLGIACGFGQLEVVRLLINRGVEVSYIDKGGWSSLHYACAGGDTEIIELLFHHHADMSCCTHVGSTPLDIACINGQLKAVRLLIDLGIEVSHVDKDGWSSLHYACQRGNTEIIKLLLDNHADMYLLTHQGSTLLDIACINGELKAALFLINLGIDVSHINRDGWSSLHYACQGGNIELIQLLLDYNADMSLLSHKGSTPLDIACLTGQLEAARFLINLGTDVSHVDKDGASSLHKACKGGNIEIIKLLLDHNADMSLGTHQGTTPLDIACLNRQLEAARFLVNRSKEVSNIDKDGWSSLHYACQGGNTKIIKLLLDHSVDLSLCTHDGSSPLDIACSHGQLEASRFLIEYGKDASHINKNGWSSLHNTCKRGLTEIIQLLLDHTVDLSLCTHAIVCLSITFILLILFPLVS